MGIMRTEMNNKITKGIGLKLISKSSGAKK
jgi:hypothetical protein